MLEFSYWWDTNTDGNRIPNNKKEQIFTDDYFTKTSNIDSDMDHLLGNSAHCFFLVVDPDVWLEKRPSGGGKSDST